MEAMVEDEKPKEKGKTAEWWASQLAQSQKMLQNWHRQGNKIVGRFIDDRAQHPDRDKSTARQTFRLNLFHRNIKTQLAILYNHLPDVDVARTNLDYDDDGARVAADMLERILNLDIENKCEDYDTVLKNVLQDRLLPGLGVARVRYTYEEESVIVGEVKDTDGAVLVDGIETTRLIDEDAPVDYYHWQDVCWGWCRGWSEMPWLAFRNYLTKKQAAERFGEDIAKALEYAKVKVTDNENNRKDEDDFVQKAQVWEIWCKDDRKVYWIGKGYDKILDTKDDPLGLRGFYPSPPFLIANATTSLYKPVPDFLLAQDLYNEVDALQTRIAIITEAVKVVGVYDASQDGIKRMLNEGFDNDLIPVENWALFAEQGAIRGVIDWFPIEDVVAALNQLIGVRDQTIALLQQITGMADVMQGYLQNQYEGVGQSQLKAQFGSAVIQTLQEEFATWVSNLMQLKAEVISKHFDPETIIRKSNVMYTSNRDMAPQAVQLLKDPQSVSLRVKVRSESMAMVDYAKLQAERTEFMTAFATFLQSAAPMVEAVPGSMPFLLKMLQWTMAGYKGGSEIEGELDKMAQLAQEQPQGQDGPDPQAQAEQIKAQGEIQKIQAKAQADQMLRQQDMQADIATINATHQAKMREIQAQLMANTQETMTKARTDAFLEQLTTEGNLAQTEADANAEIAKKWAETEAEIVADREKVGNEIAAEAAKSQQEMAAEGLRYALHEAGNEEEESDES